MDFQTPANSGLVCSQVEPNVVLSKGLFSESLPPFLAEHDKLGKANCLSSVTYIHIGKLTLVQRLMQVVFACASDDRSSHQHFSAVLLSRGADS